MVPVVQVLSATMCQVIGQLQPHCGQGDHSAARPGEALTVAGAYQQRSAAWLGLGERHFVFRVWPCCIAVSVL